MTPNIIFCLLWAFQWYQNHYFMLKDSWDKSLHAIPFLPELDLSRVGLSLLVPPLALARSNCPAYIISQVGLVVARRAYWHLKYNDKRTCSPHVHRHFWFGPIFTAPPSATSSRVVRNGGEGDEANWLVMWNFVMVKNFVSGFDLTHKKELAIDIFTMT